MICGRFGRVSSSSLIKASSLTTDRRSARLALCVRISLFRLNSSLGTAMSPFFFLVWSNFRGDSSMLIRTTLRPAGACASRKLCHLQAASASSVYQENSVGATGSQRVHFRKTRGDFRNQMSVVLEVHRLVSEIGSRIRHQKLDNAVILSFFTYDATRRTWPFFSGLVSRPLFGPASSARKCTLLFALRVANPGNRLSLLCSFLNAPP